MEIFITTMKYYTCGDYLVSEIIPLTIVSNVFMRNGTYPLMFTGRVYKTFFSEIFLLSMSV